MTSDWDARVDEFWAAANSLDPEALLHDMRLLVDERSAADPEALYEWASVHDYLGREAEAIPLYEAALAHGLSGERRPQAVVQLASSLRNVSRAEDAVRLLREERTDHGQDDAVTGDAAAAFLALALHSAGQKDEALRVALLALAKTLPLYQNAVTRYAEELE